jgi:hypothetical protein
MKLGFIAHNLRNQKYRTRYDDLKPVLDRLGFDFQPQQTPFEHVKDALVIFQQIHGHMHVSRDFDIAPTNRQYPLHLRGISLGKIISAIRHSKLRTAQKDALFALGLPRSEESTKQKYEYPLVKEALEAYRDVHGDMLVPARYIIPRKNTRFPAHLQGIRLGQIVNKIRNGELLSQHRAELIAIGFDYARQKRRYSEEAIKEALIIYERLNGKMHLIPVSYTIKESDVRFPSHLRGMPLGVIVCWIRRRNYYKKYRQDWIALGILQ